MGWPLYGIGVREYIYACPLTSWNASWPSSLSIVTADLSALLTAHNVTQQPLAMMPVEVARRYAVQQPLAVCVQVRSSPLNESFA